MLELYGYEMTVDPGEQELEELLCRVSADKRERLKGMASSNRLQSLYGDLLARYLACTQLRLKNGELVFSRNEHGKPYLAGWERFHYSISHTDGAVLVGLSQMPVGVDVEGRRNAYPKLIGRFFTGSEAAYISQGEPEWERRFFEIWTRKEAYLKWAGVGLSVPLSSFDVISGEIGVPIHSLQWNDYIASCCGEDCCVPEIQSLPHDFSQNIIAALEPLLS